MNDPNKFPPTFTITFGDVPVKCHQQNTWIYEFEEEPEQAHIFIDRSTRTVAKGIYLHKFEMEHKHPEKPKLYDKLCKSLGKIGIETIVEPYPSENDTEVYQRKLARYGLTASGLAVPEHVLETHELTPRQEHHVEYLRHILETEHLTPEDFQGNGEVYL